MLKLGNSLRVIHLSATRLSFSLDVLQDAGASDAGITRTLKRKGPAVGRAFFFVVTEHALILLVCNAPSN
jgi:hypothetical protein